MVADEVAGLRDFVKGQQRTMAEIAVSRAVHGPVERVGGLDHGRKILIGTGVLFMLTNVNVTPTILDVKVRISELSVRISITMISQTAEYALRAIVYLADQGDPRTTVEISEATQIPPGYLAKVMQSLGRAGLVNSRRGLNGGFVLAHHPSKLSILAVINAVDPIRRFAECPLGIPDHGKRLCPLHQRLNQSAAMVEKVFAESMVAELLTAPPVRRSLCRFPLETTANSRPVRARAGKRHAANRRPLE